MTRTWLVQACGFALLIVALGAILAAARQSRDADDWVRHSFEVRRAGRALLNVIESAEGDVRAYLLVNDSALLESYEKTRADVPAAKALLDRLSQDNPAQLARLNRLGPIIDERMDVLADTVALVQSGDQQALAQRIRTRRGAVLTATIRAELASFDQAEAELLAEWQIAAEKARRNLLLGSGCALSLALLLGGFATIASHRQARALQRANAQLAHVVGERTEALDDREMRLHLAAEAAGLAVSERDMRRRVIRVDARGTALTGGRLPADVWLDIDGPELAAWFALLHPDDVAAHTAAAAAMLDGTRDELSQEFRLRAPDGSWMWIATTCIVAERDPDTGKPLRLMTVGQDVTQRKNTEQQLRHAQRLEAMGQLTGGVAHDFNNLLGAILSNTEFLLDDLAAGSPAQLRAMDILDCTLNGTALTQRLLAFARRQPLQPAVIDLSEYLPGHVTMLQRTLGITVTISVELDSGLWLVHADPSQIVDVLLNLAINARDAMPHGGNLTIRATNATLDAAYCAIEHDATPGNYVLLSVTDTGVGMTPDVLAHALEPFFTTKPQGRGTGLGLSTIYGFAKQSGGFLTIASTLGGGTTVRLYLPRTMAKKTEARQMALSSLPNGDEAILVVDDNETMRMMAAQNLAALGYRLRLAADGPSALALLQAGERFDLLFTDVVMPNGISGYQLAEAARALQPGLAVLFTTGFSGDMNGSTDVTDADTLQKPYQRRDLAERVRASLDGR